MRIGRGEIIVGGIFGTLIAVFFYAPDAPAYDVARVLILLVIVAAVISFFAWLFWRTFAKWVQWAAKK